MRVEPMFIMNSVGEKIAVGTMKIKEVKVGSYQIAGGENDIFDFYVENIQLNYDEGDQIS